MTVEMSTGMVGEEVGLVGTAVGEEEEAPPLQAARKSKASATAGVRAALRLGSGQALSRRLARWKWPIR